MICPMCQKEMSQDPNPKWFDYHCMECAITFYTKEKLQEGQQKPYRIMLPHDLDDIVRLLQSLLPETDYYYFRDHKRFYTVSEMERIAKLKAFL